ncbi:lipopolysaccharide biosynthesis protein [Ferrovibrio terrae]|uniref:lipopolysaccharide biosynthesis protein n=1 Tax=Ferrovibrio terrae TaxID=2594003 RepID=UPI00163DA22A|nr:lipopolysaccharide biosynthesis protein [Ferrovibrio terrae]
MSPGHQSKTGSYDPLSTEHLQQDLTRRSLRGGLIAFGSQAVRFTAQFGGTILLARMLTPHAFGLVAMIAALSILLDLIKELGLSAATIQRPVITQQQVSTLFWINAGFGCLLALALLLAAPVIAGFYGEPELTSITRWLGLGFVVSGLTIQHWALLRRQMRFTMIAVIETGAELLALALAVICALKGAGYWALVVQRVAGPAITLVATWALCPWRPGLPTRDAEIADMLRFGGSYTGFNLLAAAARSLDQVLIGALWGPVVLGFYERAAKLVLVPLNNLNAPLYAVAMPALSRLESQPERYRHAFLLVFEKFAMVTMPPAALAAVTADWVVGLLFGPQWHDAAPFVASFSVAAITLPATMAVALLYLSQNRSGDMLRAGLADTAAVATAILAGLSFGAVGIAVAYAVANLTLRLPLAIWIGGRQGPVNRRDLAAALLPSLATAAAVAGSVAALRHTGWLVAAEPLAGLALSLGVALPVAFAIFLAIPRSRRILGILRRLPQTIRHGAAPSSLGSAGE